MHDQAAADAGFEITVSHHGLAALLHVTGQVDIFAGPALATVVQALVESGQEAVIDLTEVATLDTAGLDALSRVVAELALAGRHLSVRQPTTTSPAA